MKVTFQIVQQCSGTENIQEQDTEETKIEGNISCLKLIYEIFLKVHDIFF